MHFPFSASFLSLIGLHLLISNVVSSNNVTNEWDWGDVVTCPQSLVTGFQLTYDHQDPNNQEDKTLLNGIRLGCGIPFQSEQELEDNVVWINGTGNNATPAVFGIPAQKLFCSGYTIGFRLKIQSTKKLYYFGGDDCQIGVVNLKMICNDGEELEGHDEKWDYYPEAEYMTSPLKCSEGMGVCGVQTQMVDVQLVGDVTTALLNNLRIQCCTVPYSNSYVNTFETDTAVIVTEGNYESPFTPSPRRLNVTLYEQHINDSMDRRNETIVIKSGDCNPVPENWRKSLGALEQKSVCIRLWETDKCEGYTRCYCDSDYLKLDETFRMSRNESWYGNAYALAPCFMDDGKDYTRALIFSERNYTGEFQGSVILNAKECLTFYEGDRWHNQIASLIVTDGCLEYFDEEECAGNQSRVESGSPRNNLGDVWERKIKSVRNCNSAKLTSN